MITRASGVLLPIFSLPGDYGCGTMGRYADAFLDFLSDSGQKYWQILPLVPIGPGHSPYMSPSAFGGNPYFIDPEALVAAGWLTAEELAATACPAPDRVDYDYLEQVRMPLLRLAWLRAKGENLPELAAFRRAEAHWLAGYCDFVAQEAQAADEGEFCAFLQWLFFTQWQKLRAYAHEKNIRIIGDLPIYVSPAGADVTQHPELFLRDQAGNFAAVAGVPPDAFTALGQLWGNPLYDWAGHREEVFSWWETRIAHAARLYDVVRIDHFRGFHTYWSVPAGAEDARSGHWEPGPGMALVQRLQRAAPNLDIIAEDLGDLDQAALTFVRGSGLPGMRVLLYAFDPDGESDYLPYRCPEHSVMYTGTHDAPTFLEWFQREADDAMRQYACDFLRLRPDEGLVWGAICGAWSAPSQLAIAPMQDILGLGADGRMNLPGTVSDDNWSWRVRREALNPTVSQHLAQITHLYRR